MEKPLKTMNFGGEDTYVLAPDWNNIENAPCGEKTTYGDTLTWDGNTEGLVFVEEMGVYHISDSAPTIDDIANGASFKMLSSNGDLESTTPDAQQLADGVIMVFNGIFFVSEEAAGVPMEGVAFPKKGTYFMHTDPSMSLLTLTINNYNGFECTETVPLPNKYLDIIETVGGDTLTWDGDTSGLEYVDMGGGVLMYRVSETLPTESDFANGGHAVVKAPQVPDGMPVEFETLTAQDGAISFNDGGVLVALEDLAMGGMSVPKGVYFMDASAVGGSTTCSLTINGYTGFTKEQVKQEYLPSGVTVFYINMLNSSEYLYIDEAFTTKATKDDVMNASGVIRLKMLPDNAYILPTTMGEYGDYAVVDGVLTMNGTVAPISYYTAEYTAS